MGFTGAGSGNFHTNAQCKLSVNNTNTKGKSCPFCFMAVGDDIPGSGSLADHQQGKCIFKDREDCKMCQHCKSGVNHQLADASRQNQQNRYQEKLFVQSCMADLINQCVVCDDRDCDGFKYMCGWK